MKYLIVAISFLAAQFYVYHFLATNEDLPSRKDFGSFPMSVENWECGEQERMDVKTEGNLGVSDYFICTFRNKEIKREVGVYFGYHKSQVREAGGSTNATSIHPPKHCLPGSGWDIIETSRLTMDIEGLPVRPSEANRFVIAKNNKRQAVYYWYQSRGHIIADDWLKIVHLFWDRATRHRTDGSLVRFTVPVNQEDKSADVDKVFEAIATELLPLLDEYIPN